MIAFRNKTQSAYEEIAAGDVNFKIIYMLKKMKYF